MRIETASASIRAKVMDCGRSSRVNFISSALPLTGVLFLYQAPVLVSPILPDRVLLTFFSNMRLRAKSTARSIYRRTFPSLKWWRSASSAVAAPVVNRSIAKSIYWSIRLCRLSLWTIWRRTFSSRFSTLSSDLSRITFPMFWPDRLAPALLLKSKTPQKSTESMRPTTNAEIGYRSSVFMRQNLILAVEL